MNIFDMMTQGDGPAEQATGLICSRKGCRQPATTALLWNNPKIHAPERRKTWLACNEHLQWLEDYLKSRSLWKETAPLHLSPLSSTQDTEDHR